MSTSNQKVTKTLARPSSGQKKPLTSTTSSKMEVLPKEESKTATNFTKPLLSVKKEIKLERTGSAASKKSSSSVMSSTEVSGFDYTPDRDLMSQSSRSRVDGNQAEDLKKISSKPFSMKSKQQKKLAPAVADSNEFNQSRSTNIDASQPNLLTPATEPNALLSSQALLSNMGDDDNLLSAKQRLDFTSGNVDDLLMYDNDDLGDEKEEENIEIDINFEELHKKFEEMASRQKEIELIAKDYVAHILNAKTDTGEALVTFPKNFQEIVDNTVEETKTMEDLRDKGIVTEAGITRFIQEQVRANLNQGTKKKQEKEDPYLKEKEKIKEYDRILAQKEREIRTKKDMEKMKRMQEIQDFDEEEMSMENIDKVFLTAAWHVKKRKTGVSTAQANAQKEKLKKQEDEKVITSKPKIFAGKNHIKKNIQGAFVKAKESLIAKLSEKDQQRLESFMEAINKMIDNEGSEEDLLNEVIPNPYALGGGDGYRMQEIEQRMALLNLDQNVKPLEDLVDKSKFPKDKALRDQAEKRALQEKNDEINKKLIEINNKERLNDVCDPSVIIALVEKLKKEQAELGIEPTQRKSLDEEDELEKQFKEVVTAVSGFDTEEILNDLASLSQQTQNVQRQLKNAVSGLNAVTSMEQQKNKSGLLEMYASRKDTLAKLESDAVQNDIDAISKLEKKLFMAERAAFDAEEKMRAELGTAMPTVEHEIEPEKTVEDYDREFMEKLKLTNPELFVNQAEGEESVSDVNNEYYKDVIIEEWHDDEVNDENQEPR